MAAVDVSCRYSNDADGGTVLKSPLFAASSPAVRDKHGAHTGVEMKTSAAAGCGCDRLGAAATKIRRRL